MRAGFYGAGLGWWREAAAASKISGTWEASYSSINSAIRSRNAACGSFSSSPTFSIYASSSSRRW